MALRGTVLLIDDDRAMLEIAAAALRGAGYGVHLAEDAMQGFMAARRQAPDLILLDVRMPGGGGSQVWSRLKACRETEAIPVVVVTGTAPGTSSAAFLEQSGLTVLQKPVAPEEFVAAVEARMPPPEARPKRRRRPGAAWGVARGPGAH